VPARLHQLLAAVGVPAFVEGRTFDILAANELATVLSAAAAAGREPAALTAARPEEQAFQKNWAASSAGFIAAFRESIGDDINDPRFVDRRARDELSFAAGPKLIGLQRRRSARAPPRH